MLPCPQLLAMLGKLPRARLAVRWRAEELAAAAKTMPNEFADVCATSEPLCYTQDSFWEEFWSRGKQISGIRDFG